MLESFDHRETIDSEERIILENLKNLLYLSKEYNTRRINNPEFCCEEERDAFYGADYQKKYDDILFVWAKNNLLEKVDEDFISYLMEYERKELRWMNQSEFYAARNEEKDRLRWIQSNLALNIFDSVKDLIWKKYGIERMRKSVSQPKLTTLEKNIEIVIWLAKDKGLSFYVYESLEKDGHVVLFDDLRDILKEDIVGLKGELDDLQREQDSLEFNQTYRQYVIEWAFDEWRKQRSFYKIDINRLHAMLWEDEKNLFNEYEVHTHNKEVRARHLNSMDLA